MALDLQHFKNTLLLQRRFLILGVAVVLGSVASLAFAVAPLLQNIQFAQSQLVQEKEQLSKIQQRAALVTTITEQDREKFAIAAEALPLEKQPIYLLQMLQSLSAVSKTSFGKYDLNPGIISTESSQPVQNVRRRGAAVVTSARNMELSGEFTGTFNDLIVLVENLELARPIWEIEELAIDPVKRRTASASGSAALNYTARMTLRSYYQPLTPAALGNATAQVLNKDQQKALETLQTMKSWAPPVSDTQSSGARPGSFQNNDLFGLDGSVESAELAPTDPAAIPEDPAAAPENPQAVLENPEAESLPQ